MSVACASAMLLVPATSALAQSGAGAATAAESSATTAFNLATVATVTASGREVAGQFGPELAADNKDLPENATNPSVHNAAGASRWSANGGNGPWWLAYEFPGEATISSVNIAWGNTYATDYSIQTSDDGTTWKDVKTGLKATDKGQWVETTFDTPVKTRHIRMVATAKSQSWSLSVWEMRVMGTVTADEADPLSSITPKPLYAKSSDGDAFVLTDKTCVSVSDSKLDAAVDVLRDSLSGSYGLELADGKDCPITFTLDKTLDVSSHVSGEQSIQADESYTIDSDKDGVTVKSRTVTGGIWAAQTLLQLVGPWAGSPVKLASRASIPAATIADAPRYQWRGLLVDPARSFYPVDEVKQMIDTMSAYKINTLHLHLTDDEGARIEITNEGRADGDTTDYTKLAEKSSQLGFPSAFPNNAWSPAVDGRHGYYTQAQFIDLVTYAANRGVAIIPEIDGPGHSLGLLHGLKELNTGNSNPKPEAGKDTPDLTKDTQSKSSLATDADITYTVLAHIMDQLDTMIDKGIAASSVPASEVKSTYFHMGGDELFLGGGGTDKAQRLQTYLGRTGKLITDRSKTAVVWNDGLAAVDTIPEGSVVQNWDGSHVSEMQKLLNERNGKIVMSPAANTYFPQKPGNELTGVSWACGGACTTSNFYNWNPTASANTTEDKVLGVENALWSEHLRSLNDAELLMNTRLMATAEVGWTQQNLKNYGDWSKRAATIGISLMNRGANFHKASEINWEGSYAAVDSAAQKLENGKVLIGRYAEPGLTSTDGLHVTATYTAADGTVSELPVELSMKTAFGQQSKDSAGKLVVNSAHMNSVVDVTATLPADELASATERTGTIDVTVKSDSYALGVTSSMGIAFKGGKVVQAWTGERPTTDPEPAPVITSIKASSSQKPQVGDLFDVSKVTVVATKSDGSTVRLESADFGADVAYADGTVVEPAKGFPKAGTVTVKVYVKGNSAVSDTFQMTVTAKPVEVNKADLEAKIKDIETENLDEAKYTEESWSVLEDALSNAKKVVADATATQQQVDDALKTLTNARSGLAEKTDPEPDPDPNPKPDPEPAPTIVSITASSSQKPQVGDLFDGSKVTVVATKSDGSTVRLESADFGADVAYADGTVVEPAKGFPKAGTVTVKVYVKGHSAVSDTFEMTVTAKPDTPRKPGAQIATTGADVLALVFAAILTAGGAVVLIMQRRRWLG
ncbi:family 20 glycosylhydrolase [Bifidobacterium leontopitheci]|nr:family 20 glycosylhydrolase [Bifidobacterium leontopitheci]